MLCALSCVLIDNYEQTKLKRCGTQKLEKRANTRTILEVKVWSRKDDEDEQKRKRVGKNYLVLVLQTFLHWKSNRITGEVKLLLIIDLCYLILFVRKQNNTNEY